MPDPILAFNPFKRTSTGVGNTLEDVGDPIIDAHRGVTQIVFELENESAATALADFALLVRPHEEASYQTLISGATWGTVAGILKKYLGALNTLAAAAKGLAYVDIGPVNAFKFQAKVGSTTVLTNGTFTGNANSWTLGADWTYGANAVAAVAADTTLKQAKADMGTPWTSGVVYEVIFTISGYAAGSLQVGTNTDPEQKAAAITADGTYTVKVTADAHADGLVFTGTGFTGTIDTISATPCSPVTIVGNGYRG